MVVHIPKLTYEKVVALIVGVIIILLPWEAPMAPSSVTNFPIDQEAHRLDEDVAQQTPFIVGEVEPYTVRMDDSRKLNRGQIITYPGASFIKVHFETLNLAPGDYVTVSDPDRTEMYTYPGSDSTSDGEPGFWSMSINGDTALVQLHTPLSSGASSGSDASSNEVIIDKYGRGYPQAEIEQMLARSTCGTSERIDAVCYQETNPTEFNKSEAVARLLIYHPEGYYAFCTGWRVGVGANMLTNQHCLPTQAEVTATEAWFNYQNQTCGTSSVGSVTKVTGNRLLTSDLALDFTLFAVNNSETIADFGFLEIDARTPLTGEQIYIPQHGGGSPKQFGIASDMNEGNVCRIDAAMMDGLDNGTDTGYYCDTTGGSSGAPVLAGSSNKVIAIHHFGSSSPPGCTTLNQGVRMDLIWPRVELYLLQVSPFGSIDSYRPTYMWNADSDATWYYLWVNGPSGKIHAKWYQASAICSGQTCAVTPDVSLGGGIHTWWIQSYNVQGYGPWSNGLNFSVPTPPLPEKANLVSPTGATSDDTPLYRWNEVSDATWYYLWVNGPSGKIHAKWYTSTQAGCDGITCSVTPTTSLGAGLHTWWVQSWNGAGLGPWSEGVSFTVTVPTQTTLVSPMENISTNMPAYTWSDVPGSTWYYLWVNGPSGNIFKQWYASAQAGCNGTTCSITPNIGLSAGTYTWWVQAWNGAGLGPWGEGVSFTVTLPAQAALIAPKNSMAPEKPVYTWNEVPETTWYYLWVNGPTGNVIKRWYTSTQANCNGITCSVTPDAVLHSGEHIWWIRTWNDAGYGPWSDAATFSIP